MNGQLPLDLGHRTAHGLDDFLIAPSNRQAVAWLDRWPDWPGPALALVGPGGSGKTHLANIFALRSCGKVVRAEDLDSVDFMDVVEGVATIVVEDGDRGIDESALLHLYNWVSETGRQMLLTCRLAPARWQIRLADLGSRMSAVPVAALGPPEDALIGAVLIKTLNDRQLSVGQDVIRFVMPRIERSFDAVHAFVASVDERSMAERRNITVPLARSVLRELANAKEEN